MNKKEKFLEKCAKKYNNKYDYSLTVHTKPYKKITYICPIHGEITQNYETHFKNGCPECHKENIRIAKEKEFLRKSREIHGDLYGYDKVNFINYNTPVTLTCKKHGSFQKRPILHINKKEGCQKCTNERMSNLFSSSTEQFIEKSIKIYGELYGYDKVKYKNNHTKIQIYCKKCKKYFTQTPALHLRGSGCNICGIENARKVRSMSNDEFLKRIKEIHGDLYGYDKVNYINYNTPVIIICKEHGEVEMRPSSLLTSHGCQYCGYIKQGLTTRHTREDIIKISKEKFGDKFGYDRFVFVDRFTPSWFHCPEHSYFEIKPVDHLSSVNGCKQCGISKRNDYHTKPKEQFIKEAKKIHGLNTYGYDQVEYTNCKNEVKIYCNHHKKYFFLTPDSHLNKEAGCPICALLKSERQMCEYIESLKSKYGFKFKNQKTFNDCLLKSKLKFDFHLFKNDKEILIERDGQQHFYPVRFGGMPINEANKHFKITKIRDAIKNKYCADNNIKLFRISYERKEWKWIIEKLIVKYLL